MGIKTEALIQGLISWRRWRKPVTQEIGMYKFSRDINILIIGGCLWAVAGVYALSVFLDALAVMAIGALPAIAWLRAVITLQDREERINLKKYIEKCGGKPDFNI